MSSPRRWGCFEIHWVILFMFSVFPTQVGVFLVVDVSSDRHAGLPHAGGGVSCSPLRFVTCSPSSPRRWGCFQNPPCQCSRKNVFPTQVGVFLKTFALLNSCIRLPHAGGGVSHVWDSILSEEVSSPRRWGCFQAHG